MRSKTKLRDLGFDALDLLELPDGGADGVACRESRLCMEGVALFGATAMRAAFAKTANDAVVLSATGAAVLMEISVGALLTLCGASPVEAEAVLEQMSARALEDVSPNTLVATGIDAAGLKRAGVTLNDLFAFLRPAPEQLRGLGYKSCG